MIVFDGSGHRCQNGYCDSSDLFEIGTGTTHGTTPKLTINTSQVVNFPNNPQFGGTQQMMVKGSVGRVDSITN